MPRPWQLKATARRSTPSCRSSHDGARLHALDLRHPGLHGALDTLIIPAEASAAHDAAGTTDKRLIFIPGRGHNDISAHPLYWALLRSFLDHVTAG